MFFLLTAFIALAVSAIGFGISHRFVESRLRYVDAVQRPIAPLIAGVGAALLAVPLVAILPFVGLGTAALFGFGVFAGVSSGARAIRRRLGA